MRQEKNDKKFIVSDYQHGEEKNWLGKFPRPTVSQNYSEWRGKPARMRVWHARALALRYHGVMQHGEGQSP